MQVLYEHKKQGELREDEGNRYPQNFYFTAKILYLTV